MTTTAKGNRLEEAFHRFLLDQQSRGEPVFGVYSPDRCVIHRKKSYPSNDRGEPVQFDVVMEIYGAGRNVPHVTVVFECKNYSGSVPEHYIREFSDKLKEIFPNGAKGVIVTSSPLQSGADRVARNRKMGIVKFDEHGLDFIADRKGQTCAEKSFVQSQIFAGERREKSLKFSAFHDGNFFGSLIQFLRSLVPQEASEHPDSGRNGSRMSVPFMPAKEIKAEAQKILNLLEYKSGPVDLKMACAALSIDLIFTNEVVQDHEGAFILGSANFDRGSIEINAHGNDHRQRFTIAHEIGHFVLQHKEFLRSESVIESDLFLEEVTDDSFNYHRLEMQANIFSSFLILPEPVFRVALDVGRRKLDIRDRGHGHVYVDDQPSNLSEYRELLVLLSDYFETSQQVIEIRLTSSGLLNDQRRQLRGWKPIR